MSESSATAHVADRARAAAHTARPALSVPTWILLGLYAIGVLGITVYAGARHDYHAHLMIWQAVMAGTDPWWLIEGAPLHAYGPLFNLFAPLILLHPVAPKALFAAVYVLFTIWLTRQAAAAGGPRLLGVPAVPLIGLLLNPLPLVEVAWFGHFDVIVGVACVAAVSACVHRRDTRSGIALGIGVLIKYVPIVLLPFLAIARPRLRLSLVISALVTLVAGLTLSVLIWGPETFRPLLFAATRKSELLSIFRFLRGSWSPVHDLLSAAAFDRLAVVTLAVAGLSVFAWCWRHAVEPRAGIVLALWTTLLFYQGGFVQYQLVLMLPVVFWLATIDDRHWFRQHVSLLVSLAVYFTWITAFDLLYAWIGGYLTPTGGWQWLDDVMGLPTFLLGCWSLVELLRATRSTGSGPNLAEKRAEW